MVAEAQKVLILNIIKYNTSGALLISLLPQPPLIKVQEYLHLLQVHQIVMQEPLMQDLLLPMGIELQ